MCFTELYKIFKRFNLHLSPSVKLARKSHKANKVARSSTLFCLSYDLSDYETNTHISELVCNEIPAVHENFGMISGYDKYRATMDIIQRDFPMSDSKVFFEHFYKISDSLGESFNEKHKFSHFFDLIFKALKKISKKREEKKIVIFWSNHRTKFPKRKIEDIQRYIENCKVFIVNFDEKLSEEMKNFLEHYSARVIQNENNLDQLFERVSEVVFESLI